VIVLAMKFPQEIRAVHQHGKEKAKYKNQIKQLERVDVMCV